MRNFNAFFRPASEPLWETLIDYGNAQNAVGLTTVLVFTDYGSDYRDLAVHLSNEDGGSEVLFLVVDQSHAGTKKSGPANQRIEVAAGEEGYALIAAPNPLTYLRVAVESDGSTVSFKWALLGRRR